MPSATPTETKTTTTSTVLKARLKSDGTFAYELPKREGDKLRNADELCGRLENIPALKEKAESARMALSLLMAAVGC